MWHDGRIIVAWGGGFACNININEQAIILYYSLPEMWLVDAITVEIVGRESLSSISSKGFEIWSIECWLTISTGSSHREISCTPTSVSSVCPLCDPWRGVHVAFSTSYSLEGIGESNKRNAPNCERLSWGAFLIEPGPPVALDSSHLMWCPKVKISSIGTISPDSRRAMLPTTTSYKKMGKNECVSICLESWKTNLDVNNLLKTIPNNLDVMFFP